MGRKRKHDRELPEGLYKAGRKYRRRIYVGPDRAPAWETFDTLEEALRIVAGLDTRGTLAKGLERYRDEIMPRELAEETQRTEKPRINRLIRVFGHMNPDHVSQQDVYAYLDARPTVAGNRELARFSVAYRWMIRWGMAKTNPCIGILRAKEAVRDRYVTDAELDMTLALALDRAFHGRRTAAIVYGVLRLEYLTGRRESTILGLRLSDLTDTGILFRETKVARRNARGEIVKKPKQIIVGWSPELRRATTDIKRLCALPKGSGTVIAFSSDDQRWLFPNRDGAKTSPGSFNQAWRTVREWLDQAGVDPFQPRDIRAKHETDFIESDLGHADPRTTEKHYQRRPKTIKPLR